MSEHRARGGRKSVVRTQSTRAAHAGRSRHGVARSGRGRYLGVGTGLAVGLTGVLMQVDLGSPASGATIRSADTWTQLSGALTEGTPARTVSLGADIAAPAGAAPLAVPSGESVVLDLHGHTLAIAPGGIALGDGSSLQLQDATAGVGPVPSSGDAGKPAPAAAMHGYDGRGGLTGAPPSAAPHLFYGPQPLIEAPIYGPRPSADPGPVPVASAAPAPTPSALSTQTAAPTPAAPIPAEPQATAAIHPSAHPTQRHADRPRGRHRRHAEARHHLDSPDRDRGDEGDDCHWPHMRGPRGHWVDDYYYWWTVTDAA